MCVCVCVSLCAGSKHRILAPHALLSLFSKPSPPPFLPTCLRVLQFVAEAQHEQVSDLWQHMADNVSQEAPPNLQSIRITRVPDVAVGQQHATR